LDGPPNAPLPTPDLLGRHRECAHLDELLERVRAGQSRVLVLRGEAGVGKTALLEYLVANAGDCSIARAAGIESEMELAFAGLHQLCAPMLDRRGRLPGPQADALGTAFGLSAGEAPDRFLVGLAVLGLLSDVAEERPFVGVVDDAQWLDQASVQILAFVARRLQVESVGLVFTVREPTEDDDWTGLPQHVVRGLGEGDARALLEAATPGRLDESVRDRIVAETRGNPLALLQLPRGLTMAELAGGFALPYVQPLTSRIEQSFLRQLQSLPDETQQLLLTATAQVVGDVALLWRAAGLLGIGTDAAAPAEAAGLIELGEQVRFRHPLVRSAVYRTAGLRDRQAVHRALADATDPDADPERRAWHRAQAAPGPDEAVARELERSADRARGRGGVAAAAAFLKRATELTPDPSRRGARALAAAQAKFEAGAPDAANELIAVAQTCPLGELQRARLARLRGQIAFTRTRGKDAPSLLLDAARLLEPLDSGLAREAYLEALGAAIFAGRLRKGCGVLEVAKAARATYSGSPATRATDFLLNGLAVRFTEGPTTSMPLLKRALDAFCEEDGGSEDDIRWLWMACRIAPDVWDDESWHWVATRHLQLANDAGALTVLPIAATYRAGVHVHAGEFSAAEALINQADATADAAGIATLRYTSLVLVAWRGREGEAVKLIDASVRDATARGEGRAVALAAWATALLYNGLGLYKAALAAAQQACEYDDLGLFGSALIEVVEAGVRSGAHDVAASALAQLEERTRAAGTNWALGIGARSRALLSGGPAADSLYREAIDRLERTRIVVHVARTHLVYGEWLRREHRRVEARDELRAAHEMFASMGAEAFAERARRELLATGETVHKRSVGSRDMLTAQEAQIASLVGEGRTNAEIGAQLFISPRTVEYHLHKLFTKLGISSRRELRVALLASDRSSSPA
jgi:DNA-binding CsgD family transcriptional regulator